MILNVYALNNRALKQIYESKTELKEERDKPTSIVEVFNIPLLVTDRTTKQKNN